LADENIAEMQLLTILAYRGFWPVFGLLLLGGWLAFAPAHPAQAQGMDELYAIHDVAVDVTAESAAIARDKAIADSQRNALGQLLARMGASFDMSKLTDTDITNLVQNFEINSERSSAVRYIGNFTIRFKPNDIRMLLQGAGVSYSELRSKPVLVLPMMPSGGRTVLWEEPTPWHDAWIAAAKNDGLVPLLVPAGELDDIAVASTAEITIGDPVALAKAAIHYNAGGIIVPVLQNPTSGIDPAQPLAVTVNRYDDKGMPAAPVTLNVPAMPGQNADAMIYAAVTMIRDQLEKGWQQATRVTVGGPAVKLQVRVPIQSLQDWAVMRQRLTKVSTINKVDVISLTRDSAHIELTFAGDVSQLQMALAQSNLALQQGYGVGAWELHKKP
jgi:hypothetical protein